MSRAETLRSGLINHDVILILVDGVPLFWDGADWPDRCTTLPVRGRRVDLDETSRSIKKKKLLEVLGDQNNKAPGTGAKVDD